MWKKKLHMYCILEGHLQKDFDKLKVDFHFCIPYSTFERSVKKLLQNLQKTTFWEMDLLKCNTYATFFSTLHFIEVKVLYVFAKIDFSFGFDEANFRKAGKKCIFGTLIALVV